MNINHTSMTKIVDKGYDFLVECEATIPTKQYGNRKPKISVTVPIEDVSGVLQIMRKILNSEELKINNELAGGNNGQ